MEQGWIKLHRQLLNNKIFRFDLTAWRVFEILLLICDRNTGKWEGGRYQLTSMCGEGFKEAAVYKSTLRLEKEGMIERFSNNHFTTYSICNWEQYQSTQSQPSNNQVTTKSHSNKKEEVRSKNKHIGLIFKNEELRTAFTDFSLMRKSIKKPLTDRAAQIILAKLEKMYPGQINMQIKCLEQSTEHSWQTVYVIKTDPTTLIASQKIYTPSAPVLSDEERSRGREKLAEIRNGLRGKGVFK